MDWSPRVLGGSSGKASARACGLTALGLTGSAAAAGGSEPDPAATLWVAPAPAGDDSRSKATVAASGGSLPWATIERAVWGSNDRTAMVTGEAADAGDVVSILGSATYGSPTLYTTNVVINGQSPVYLPANTGTAGNYITFQANGYVQLGSPAANAPVVGNLTGKDYIKWYADRADSRFIIVCDGSLGPPVNISSSSAAGGVLTVHTSGAHGITTGQQVIVRNHDCTPAIQGPLATQDLVPTATVIDSDTFTIANQTYTAGGGATGTVRRLHDTKSDPAVVNTIPDTGPVMLTDHCWIEGFDIDGGERIDYDDNWEGIRVSNGQGYTIRNNYIHDFRKDSDENATEDTSINQTGITMYGAQNGLIEHNLIENCGAGIYFKDTGAFQATLGNTIRYNWISLAEVLAAVSNGQGIRWSLLQTGLGHDTNTIYQNVITDCLYAFGNVTSWNDDVYNNTVVRCTAGVGTPGNANGARYWNNIFSVTDWVMLSSGGTQAGHTVCDFEHNLYYGFGASTFMTDANNHSFAQWLTEYDPDQDRDSPASVNSDPLFTNAAADDFTLQAGSPARSLASNLGVGTDAGAYQYGVSITIGLEG
jgi:hypothetical protein